MKIEYSFLLLLMFFAFIKNKDFLFVLLFSLFHEAGHFIVLYLLGGRAETLTFSCYGIGLKHNSNLSKTKEILFLSGGVVLNLFFVLINVKTKINLALFLINILPLYPLDGGRILKILFELKVRYFKIFTYLFSALLLVFSVYIKNISLLIISVYVILFSVNEDLK